MVFCWGKHVKECFPEADTDERMLCYSKHFQEALEGGVSKETAEQQSPR